MEITQEHKDKAEEIKLMLKNLDAEVVHLLTESLTPADGEDCHPDIWELINEYGEEVAEWGGIVVSPAIFLPDLIYTIRVDEKEDLIIESVKKSKN